MIHGRILARNALWNLLGTGLPLLVAVWAIPLLVRGLGIERFGLMTMVWMLVGYFSLFDLGIGRALTREIASTIAAGHAARVPSLFRAGMRLMWALGAVSALLLGLLAPWLGTSAMAMADSLRPEAVASFMILAATLPFVITSAGYVGVLEANQEFPMIARVRLPLGISNYLGPVLLLPLTRSLVAVTAFVALSRLLAWWLFRQRARRLAGLVSVAPTPGRAAIGPMLAFGGWLTVSNIAGPLMVTFDRILIAALLGLGAVAYYTTPLEVLTRLWVVPAAVMGVLFPAFVASLATFPDRAAAMFESAGGLLLAALVLPLGLACLFAREALDGWLGAAFASQSSGVARVIAIGVLVNCLARLPFTALQSHGRADLTAKLHLLELVAFLPLLYWCTSRYGIIGAATAWTARMGVDALALHLLGARQLPVLRGAVQSNLVWTTLAVAALALLCLPFGMAAKAVLAAVLTGVCLGSIFLQIRRHRLSPGPGSSLAAADHRGAT